MNPLPVSHVKRDEDDLLVVVDLNANIPYAAPRFDSDLQQRNKIQHLQILERFRSKWARQTDAGKSEATRPSYIGLIQASINLMQEKISSLQFRSIRTRCSGRDIEGRLYNL